mgnify:CR=1 FL=1
MQHFAGLSPTSVVIRQHFHGVFPEFNRMLRNWSKSLDFAEFSEISKRPECKMCKMSGPSAYSSLAFCAAQRPQRRRGARAALGVHDDDGGGQPGAGRGAVHEHCLEGRRGQVRAGDIKRRIRRRTTTLDALRETERNAQVTGMREGTIRSTRCMHSALSALHYRCDNRTAVSLRIGHQNA